MKNIFRRKGQGGSTIKDIFGMQLPGLFKDKEEEEIYCRLHDCFKAADSKALKELVETLPGGVEYQGSTANRLLVSSVHNDSSGGTTKTLIELGADINAPNKASLTAVMAAVNTPNPAALDILIQYGADLTLKDPHGRTALNMARHKPYFQPADPVKQAMAQKLETTMLAQGVLTHADVAAMNAKQAVRDLTEKLYNALHDRKAADIGPLIAQGADPYCEVMPTYNALNYALQRGYEPEVKALLAAGVDHTRGAECGGELAITVAKRMKLEKLLP